MSIGYKLFNQIRQWREWFCEMLPAVCTCLGRGGVSCVAIIIVTTFFPAKGNTAELSLNIEKRLVIIDPGHGGQDIGARGPAGTLEKAMTLKVAKILAARLHENYRVVLTRRDDYPVGILERTATANHLKADIFISIHTGGGFIHKTSGISIFFFKKAALRAFRPQTEDPAIFKNKTGPIGWDDLQIKHTTNSQRLAESIQAGIQAQKQPLTCKRDSAPLLVLAGADMPAILIEIGYLTNPSDEKALKDPKAVSRLVEGIYQGISHFFIDLKRTSGP